MPLRESFILEIDGYDGRTGVFELREGLEDTQEVDPTHIAGNRGQYISELYDQITSIDPTDWLPEDEDLDRRAGYHLDGGAGEDTWTVTGETAVDSPDEQWGDGTTDPEDPEDISLYDATGCHPLDKRDILAEWIVTNRVDSTNAARLYRGQWSDGTHADEPGVFNRPLSVAIQSVRLSMSAGDASAAEISLELVRTNDLPDLGDDIADLIDAVGDYIEDF